MVWCHHSFRFPFSDQLCLHDEGAHTLLKWFCSIENFFIHRRNHPRRHAYFERHRSNLLFLNGGYDEEVGHMRWFPNTPNQLFKATGGDSGTAYKNVFVSDEIPSITEEDVLDAI